MLNGYARNSVLAIALMALTGNALADDVPGFDYDFAFQPAKKMIKKRRYVRPQYVYRKVSRSSARTVRLADNGKIKRSVKCPLVKSVAPIKKPVQKKILKKTYPPVSNASNESSSLGNHSFARDGKSYYMYGGYVVSHHLNDRKTLVELGSDYSTEASINPKTDIPDTFHSIEIGVGKEWGKHFDMQIAYFQQFEKKKNETITVLNPSILTSSVAKIKTKGAAFNFLYVFNPKDQIQFGTGLGFVIAHVSDTVSANGITYALPDNDTTEIDPSIGLEMLWQIKYGLAFKLNTQYIWKTDSKVSSGEINTLFGLAYTL